MEIENIAIISSQTMSTLAHPQIRKLLSYVAPGYSLQTKQTPCATREPYAIDNYEGTS
jgi:hypothetical protein